MGIGNYSEDDIKEAARAFTGWTFDNVEYMTVRAEMDSMLPYGRYALHFRYLDDDHDDGEKTFQGGTGDFNGEDILRIICEQPATAHFISRHLYDFFVADEAPVPQWPYTPPRDPEAIEILSSAYFESRHNVGAMLSTLFNSDFFKESQFERVKCPAELVAGTLRLSGGASNPDLGVPAAARLSGLMGQALLNPPSVEGWHEGIEWISSGSIIERVNFAAAEINDPTSPGVKDIIERLASNNSGSVSAEEVVDGCLDLVGPLDVASDTRSTLIRHTARDGDLSFSDPDRREASEARVADLLALIVATREYQLA